MLLNNHTLPRMYFSFYYSLSLIVEEDVGRGHLFYQNRCDIFYEYQFGSRIPSTELYRCDILNGATDLCGWMLLGCISSRFT